MLSAGVYLLEIAAMAQGDIETAKALLGSHPECLNGIPLIQFRKGSLAFAEGRYGDARKEWRAAAAQGPMKMQVDFLVNTGASHQREGELDSAQHYYEEALRLQGDRVELMTINNIVSILNVQDRYDEVRPFFEVGVRLDRPDSLALEMLHWNMISAEVMLNRKEAAGEVIASLHNLRRSAIPEYALEVYWMYLLMVDDFDSFVRSRSLYTEDQLATHHADALPFLKDLFDDGRFEETARLPLSVKWTIAQRGLVFAQQVIASQHHVGVESVLQQQLEENLADQRFWNRVLMLSLLVALLTAVGTFVWSSLAMSRRAVMARDLAFTESDHKSVQAIREALVSRSGMDSALEHLAELRELLEAKQLDSLERITSNVDLTPTELRLLELIGKSYSALECARMLDCTKSHVYNLRSSIRKKLNISESVSLKAWVRSELGG
jgi:DNA-binding CsgD family transcriptional regulator